LGSPTALVNEICTSRPRGKPENSSGIRISEQQNSVKVGALRAFLAFHQASNLVIEHSEPADFGDALLRLL